VCVCVCVHVCTCVVCVECESASVNVQVLCTHTCVFVRRCNCNIKSVHGIQTRMCVWSGVPPSIAPLGISIATVLLPFTSSPESASSMLQASHMTNRLPDKHATSKSHDNNIMWQACYKQVTWQVIWQVSHMAHENSMNLENLKSILYIFLTWSHNTKQCHIHCQMLRHIIILLPNLVTLISANNVRIADE